MTLAATDVRTFDLSPFSAECKEEIKVNMNLLSISPHLNLVNVKKVTFSSTDLAVETESLKKYSSLVAFTSKSSNVAICVTVQILIAVRYLHRRGISLQSMELDQIYMTKGYSLKLDATSMCLHQTVDSDQTTIKLNTHNADVDMALCGRVIALLLKNSFIRDGTNRIDVVWEFIEQMCTDLTTHTHASASHTEPHTQPSSADQTIVDELDLVM